MTNDISTDLQPITKDLDVKITSGNIFTDGQAFSLAARLSNAFAKSTLVPAIYQNNPSNCLIAFDMASRLNMPPMMVMQNLYVISGRPAWSAQFITAMINGSHKYKTELQYDIKGSGETLECTAWVIDQNDHKVIGPTITMGMAKKEGWVSKNGSKWQTMPEVMIRYRAAAFFGRLNCPDMIMGIYSKDEAEEFSASGYRVIDADPAAMLDEPNNLVVDNSTGEVESDGAETEQATA